MRLKSRKAAGFSPTTVLKFLVYRGHCASGRIQQKGQHYICSGGHSTVASLHSTVRWIRSLQALKYYAALHNVNCNRTLTAWDGRSTWSTTFRYSVMNVSRLGPENVSKSDTYGACSLSLLDSVACEIAALITDVDKVLTSFAFYEYKTHLGTWTNRMYL